MQIEIDKKGLKAVAAIAGIAAMLFAVGSAVRMEVARLRVPQAPAVLSPTVADEAAPDENAFYLSSPAGNPVFLAPAEITKKRAALMWEKRDFIFADLDSMALTLYASGTPAHVFPVVAKPEQGSFFSPPAGFYTIQGKAERHVSKLSSGVFSWAVYLFGNYMIHAGMSVPKTAAIFGATGAPPARPGGIRLADADAKELFSFAHEGMPALVSGGGTAVHPLFSYFRKSVLPHSVPQTTAAAVLAADLDTGEILFEKNKSDSFPIASITKLITALVAQDRIPPSQLLVVGNEALRVSGNAAGLIKGEIFPARELLYGMILPSSNNAAKILELAVPGFIGRMNEKAKEIGMSRTAFGDSSGLSRENVSSAADLFTLLRYLDQKHPEILKISEAGSHTATSQNKIKTHVWMNINWPRDDTRFLGGKTGFTDDSLQTMAGIYRVRATEFGGRRIGMVVLGSRNRVSDIRSLIGYLEKNYVYGYAVSGGKDRPQAVFSGAAAYRALKNY